MVEIRIPATSANLGSGFDSIGLALNLHNTVGLEEADRLTIRSLDGVPIPLDEHSLVYRAACRLYDLCGRRVDGFTIEQRSRIPMARGLGSSSACIVGGLMGANELLGRPLDRAALVDLATEIEGHPDNVAPALLGGFVASAVESGRVYTVRRTLPEGKLAFAVMIPDFPLRTAEARAVLPEQVSHADAIYNLSRTSLLTAALLEGRYELLAVAMGDRLHQPYRLPLIDHAESWFAAAKEAGAYASAISGAGSSLLSVLPASRAEAFRPQAEGWLRQNRLDGWRFQLFGIDNEGASVV